MKKRRTKINLGSSPADHREKANKDIRTANEFLLRVKTRKTCAEKLSDLRNANDFISHADAHFEATGSARGRQRTKVRRAIYMLQSRINGAFDDFVDVCARKVPGGK